jgi:riboflavin transporter FmnP
MLLPVIIPFNAAKVAINGLITFLIYKPVSKLVKLPETRAKKGEANS